MNQKLVTITDFSIGNFFIIILLLGFVLFAIYPVLPINNRFVSEDAAEDIGT